MLHRFCCIPFTEAVTKSSPDPKRVQGSGRACRAGNIAVSIVLNNFFILAVPGLRCGMWDIFSCGMWTPSCGMHAGSSSPTRDWIRAPCIGSAESYLLDHQGSPCCGHFWKHNLPHRVYTKTLIRTQNLTSCHWGQHLHVGRSQLLSLKIKLNTTFTTTIKEQTSLSTPHLSVFPCLHLLLF